jgi:hypothetical protein
LSISKIKEHYMTLQNWVGLHIHKVLMMALNHWICNINVRNKTGMLCEYLNHNDGNINLLWIYEHNWGKCNMLSVLHQLISSVWLCIQAQDAGISRMPFWSLVAQLLPAFFHQTMIFLVLFWYPTKSKDHDEIFLQE